jgi:hypothetical protein
LVRLVDIIYGYIPVQVEDHDGQNKNAAYRNQSQAHKKAGIQLLFLSQDDRPFK